MNHMFMINTQYVNYRHQRRFLNCDCKWFCINTRYTLLQLHVTCTCLSEIRNVSDVNKVLSKSNCLNMRKLTLNIGTIADTLIHVEGKIRMPISYG